MIKIICTNDAGKAKFVLGEQTTTIEALTEFCRILDFETYSLNNIRKALTELADEYSDRIYNDYQYMTKDLSDDS